MARARNRDAVMKTLRKSLDEDRTKTFTAEISKLGLVEMTRQNVTEGVREIMTRPCPTCDGEGVIRSEETIAIEFERRLRDIGTEARKGVEAFLVQMNPRVSAQFTGDGARVLHALEERDRASTFHFEGSEGLPLDHFAITMEGARDEVEERAVPFREGDEVLVHIVEPHMYDVDDAVAKIDGYIISVAGGGPLVGREAPRAHRARPAAPPRPPSWSTRPASAGQPGTADDGDAYNQASAPWPQGRTAPFACHGRHRRGAGFLEKTS